MEDNECVFASCLKWRGAHYYTCDVTWNPFSAANGPLLMDTPSNLITAICNYYCSFGAVGTDWFRL